MKLKKAVLSLHDDAQLREALIQNGYRRAKSSFNYASLAEKFDLGLHKLCSSSSDLQPYWQPII